MIVCRADARLLTTLLVSCILLLELGGCGFRLRGAAVIPPEMAVTRIEGTAPRGPLGEALAASIRGAGGTVVDQSGEAESVLRITVERFDRRVLSVGGDRKVSEYELNYTVGFMLLDAGGEVVVPEQDVSVTRDYTFDAASVLGKADEEELLRAEMLRFAVQQILRRLHAQALSAKAADPRIR